ncbi:thioredoxin domain-containing protein [Lacicoccus alkaliphilus]|nr:thioredoxin domain-containing protein [Salinicoccus alkaliphilus]
MTNEVRHLVLGSEEAATTVESYINMGCPFCSTYIEVIDEIFAPHIESGEVKHIIKHVDRTNGALLKGAVAGTYLNIHEPEKTYEDMKHLLETRPEWTASFEEALMKLETLGLVEQEGHGARSKEILDEAAERGVRVVPTVFIDGDKFDFPVKGTNEEIAEAFRGKIESS